MESSSKKSSYQTAKNFVIHEVTETMIEKVIDTLRQSIIELKIEKFRESTVTSLEWVLDCLQNNKDLYNYKLEETDGKSFENDSDNAMIMKQIKDFTGAALNSEVTTAAKRLQNDVSVLRQSILKKKTLKSTDIGGGMLKHTSPGIENKKNFISEGNRTVNMFTKGFNKAKSKHSRFSSNCEEEKNEDSEMSLEPVTPLVFKNDQFEGIEIPISFREEPEEEEHLKEFEISKAANLKMDSDSESSIKKYSLRNSVESKTVVMKKPIVLDTSIDIEENEVDKLTDIFSLEFSIFAAHEEHGDRTLQVVFTKIVHSLEVDNDICSETLSNFCDAVNEGYFATVQYHNALHGTDVCQSIFSWIENSEVEELLNLNKFDLLAFYTAAIVHDIGHPGYNNAFQINSLSELALTYNDKSVLENFHISKGFKIMLEPKNNILKKLNKQDIMYVRKRMIESVMATDMSLHGKILSSVKPKVHKSSDQLINQNGNLFDEQQEILNFIIHSADISHNCKKFEISKKWTALLFDEFFEQGDLEKKLGLPVSFNCDRETVNIPPSQIGFIKGVIMPNFEILSGLFVELAFTVDNCKDNIEEWAREIEQKGD